MLCAACLLSLSWWAVRSLSEDLHAVAVCFAANVEYKVESAHRPHRRRRRASRERHRRAIVTRSLESELDLPTPSDPNLSGLSAAALALDPLPSQASALSPRGALELPAGVPLLAPMRPTLQMPMPMQMPMQMQMALSGEQRALAFNPLLASQMASSIARGPAVAGGLPVAPEAVAASASAAVDPDARLMAPALSRSAPSDVLRRDLLLLQQHPQLYQPSTRSLGRHAHRVALAAAVGGGSGHSGASSSRASHTLPQFAVPPLTLRPLHMRPPPPASTFTVPLSLQSQLIPAPFSGGTGLFGVSGASFAPITTLAVFGPESAPQLPQPPPSATLSTVVALHQPPPSVSVTPTAGGVSSSDGSFPVAAASSSSYITSSSLPPKMASVQPALSVAPDDVRIAPCPLSTAAAKEPLTSSDSSDAADTLELRALSAQAAALSPAAGAASECYSDALATDSVAPVDGSGAVPVAVQMLESGAAAASERSVSVSGSDGRTASFASAQSSVAPIASGAPVSPPATATQAAVDATATLLTASTASQLLLLSTTTANATASSESAGGETVPVAPTAPAAAASSTTSTACALQICISSANAAHSNAPASSASATPTSGSQPHVPRTRSSRDHQFDPGQFYQPYVFATAGQTRAPMSPAASVSASVNVSAAGGARPLTSPAAAPPPPPPPGAALHQQHSPGAALAIASQASPPTQTQTQAQTQQQRGPVAHSGTAGTTGARTGTSSGGGGRLLPSIGRHLRRLGGTTRPSLSEKEKCRLHELEELNALTPHSTDPERRICSIHSPD